VPVPQYTVDEIDAALAADKRLANSYHSLSIYLRKHNGCRDEDVAPLDGSILFHLWQRGKLRRRQLLAWKFFWRDLQRAYGESGPLTISYTERVSTSSAGVPRADGEEDEPITGKGVASVKMAEWNDEHTIITQKWDSLRREERGIMEQLIRDHIKVNTGLKIHCHDLGYLGAFLSGYNDNRQAIAAGVSRVQALLNNLADLYMISDQ
jgi:hypothetical protein